MVNYSQPPLKYIEPDLNLIFSALSHPIRRQILMEMQKGRMITVNKIAAPLKISLPAVSKHIKILEKAGLIHRLSKSGRHYFFRPHQWEIRTAERWIKGYTKKWDDSAAKMRKEVDSWKHELEI